MRTSRAVAAGAAAIAITLVAGSVPAYAAARAAAPLSAAAAAQPAAATTAATPINASATLITGDKVTVSTGSGGTPTVKFTPAARPSGKPVSYTSWGGDGHYYVVPSDVAPLVGSKLDLSLFDVPELATIHADGLDGAAKAAPSPQAKPAAAATSVPVIVQAAAPKKGATAAPPTGASYNVTTRRTLRSIRAIAGSVPVAGATKLLDAVKAGTSVDHVWLDKPLKAADDGSNSLIGAPTAWGMGLDGTGVTVGELDTGIDTSHPDLAGVVTAAQDFTGEGTTNDLNGHGTHVASIIAGSGAASGGTYKGVAPGVHIISGRVLNENGQGDDSWVIAGMEWAAASGASIINMSLGDQGEYTDGTDPTAEAVDALSAQYNTLFVIAAGNDGYSGDFTVSTPGSADAALTVGAVDSTGTIAPFSSEGPRFGDWAIKPDIAADGVNITAARAAGTSDGDESTVPADLQQYYTTMSGTSMATPAVVGSAAILKEAHPELTAEQLKDQLMGTATPSGNSLFAEGAGVVDIPDAVKQPVSADPASLSFGQFTGPRNQQAPRTKTVTYSNDGAQDATLDLTLSLNEKSGGTVPSGEASLSADTLVVPAHGTTSVDVTVNPQAGSPDLYAGVLNATYAGVNKVRTVLAFEDQDTLTIAPTGFASGQTVSGGAWVYSIDDPSQAQYVVLGNGPGSVSLPDGRYAVVGELFAITGEEDDSTTMFTEDATLDNGSATIVVDQRKAKITDVDAPKATVTSNFEDSLTRTIPGLSYPVIASTTEDAAFGESRVELPTYILPLTAPIDGSASVGTMRVLDQPVLDVSVTGRGAPLDVAEELSYGVLSPRLTGTVNARLVDAGTGTAAEFAAAKAKGAIALVEVPSVSTFLDSVTTAAHNAGAIAVIAYTPGPGPYIQTYDTLQLDTVTFEQAVPVLTVSHDVALALQSRARAGGRVQGTGLQNPSYQYVAAYSTSSGVIPASLTYRPSAKQLAAVPVSVQASVPGTPMTEWVDIVNGDQFVGFPHAITAPATRTVYYTTQPGFSYAREVGTDDEQNSGTFASTPVAYRPGPQPKETFLGVQHGGLRPGSDPASAAVSRSGDTLTVNLPYRVDSAGHVEQYEPNSLQGDTYTSHLTLTQGTTAVVDSPTLSEISVAANPAAEPYKLTLKTTGSDPQWTQSAAVTTTWGFRSATTSTATALPLLQLDYGVQGLDPTNTGGRTTKLDLTVAHQAGSGSKAKVTGVQLWASFDHGAHWVPVTVTAAHGDGKYTASVTAPKGATSVSLRSHATDAASASYDETVIDAYAVK